MRKILTNDEMALIVLSKKGWVLNWRPESRKVHHASCEALSAMVVREHPKYFSDNRADAREWLEQRFGSRWRNCTYCNGLSSSSD